MFPTTDPELNFPSTAQCLQLSDATTEGVDHLPALTRTTSPRHLAPSPRHPSPAHDPQLDPLEFSMTQPFQDPRGRLHSAYTRRIRNLRETSDPRMKVGRAGGTWRHVSLTNGHQGNNIMFIEGTVKQDDAGVYPPYGWRRPGPASFMHYVSPRVLPHAIAYRGQKAANTSNYTTYYNNHARNGFKYWYEEKKPKNRWQWKEQEAVASFN